MCTTKWSSKPGCILYPTFLITYFVNTTPKSHWQRPAIVPLIGEFREADGNWMRRRRWKYKGRLRSTYITKSHFKQTFSFWMAVFQQATVNVYLTLTRNANTFIKYILIEYVKKTWIKYRFFFALTVLPQRKLSSPGRRI